MTSISRPSPPPEAHGAGMTRFEATVLRRERLAPDIVGLLLVPDPQARFSYRPGQYLSVLLPQGDRRSFSMASAGGVGRPIELHVRRRPGGRFSDTTAAKLQPGDRLWLEGPFGQVDWREGRGPVILMGTGTGLAPLKALLEHGLASDGARAIHLYWGGRVPTDHYLGAYLEQLARRHARFYFTPLLSRVATRWVGRRGYVQDAVAEDFADLNDAQLYACGSPDMIHAARERLARLPGFHEDRFQADAFEPAATLNDDPLLPFVRLSIHVRGATREVQGREGGSLLSALQVAGAPILSVCGGRASCGTCKVNVTEPWRARLPPPARTEQRLLANLDDISPGDRLACQIRLTPQTDGLTVCLVCR
jgi:CDP-4-dehydro-6-deoxyglucose reductase, E3